MVLLGVPNALSIQPQACNDNLVSQLSSWDWLASLKSFRSLDIVCKLPLDILERCHEDKALGKGTAAATAGPTT
eukprot:783439-Pelagomonas_calceolata.AAC.1